MSEPRSWLFVPADSEKKIGKAIESEADAVIFDLEDSVALGQKAAARQILKDLGKRAGGPQCWVRINPLRIDEHRKDHIVEVTVIGTAIAQFASTRPADEPSLAILSLDPQRRQVARVRLGR